MPITNSFALPRVGTNSRRFAPIYSPAFGTTRRSFRYGTRGQAQNGIDIYGKNDGADSGVQCKGKRDWPPTKLTISEIDEEVEKAKAFSPKLRSFIIATTDENDARLTDRANAISAEHEKSGHFRVTVYGWTEIVRRLNDYPDLLKKHFSSFTLRRLEENMPDAVADRVVEKLNAAKSTIDPRDREQAPRHNPAFSTISWPMRWSATPPVATNALSSARRIPS
jgi:hypothetical protein